MLTDEGCGWPLGMGRGGGAWARPWGLELRLRLSLDLRRWETACRRGSGGGRVGTQVGVAVAGGSSRQAVAGGGDCLQAGERRRQGRYAGGCGSSRQAVAGRGDCLQAGERRRQGRYAGG